MKKHYEKSGKLEVICGSMFSGKSDELIRRLKRSVYARQEVQVFKHSFDDRSSITHVVTHNGNKIHAMPVSFAEEILELVTPECEVVGIDEVQFFELSIIVVIDKLVRLGKRVIAAGLDLDFRGLPFGPTPHLLALADEVTKLRAVCMRSGKEAHFTQRLLNGKPASYEDPVVLIGAENVYEPRAREQYEIDDIPLTTYIQKLLTS